MTNRVRSLRAAAAFVDRAGLALVFPKETVALPSLLEAVAGPGPVPWAVEREDGKMAMGPEFSLVWSWKDELPEQRLACAGKHIRGVPSLVSLRLLPALYALTGRSGEPVDFRDAVLPPLEREIAEAVLGADAPPDSREIRRLVGVRDTARVSRAIDSLQRGLVLTRAGADHNEHRWGSTTYDILARRYRLGRLPEPAEARTLLVDAVVQTAGELSQANVARILGISRADAQTALERAKGPDTRPGPPASVQRNASRRASRLRLREPD